MLYGDLVNDYKEILQEKRKFTLKVIKLLVTKLTFGIEGPISKGNVLSWFCQVKCRGLHGHWLAIAVRW